MKREKFSPTIEQKDSILSKVKLGMGKKAAALLLTGSATLGVASCDSDNKNTPPVSSETSVSVEATEQNNHQYGRIEHKPHPELSTEAKKIEAQYGSISEYPMPVDFYMKNPVTGEEGLVEDISQKTIDSITISEDGVIGFLEYESYVPQIEQFAERNRTVEVNGSQYDTERLVNDPAYMDAMTSYKTYEHIKDTKYDFAQQGVKTASKVRAEVLSAISLSEGGIINEYIKAEYINKYDSNRIYLGEREYKLLDENASNQEILDNYDIETAVMTSIPDKESRSRLLQAHNQDKGLGRELDMDIVEAILDPSDGVIYNSHKVVKDFDNPRNLARKAVELNHAPEILAVREIYATNSVNGRNGNPEFLTFMYYDYDGFQKWINVQDVQMTDVQWNLIQDNAKKKAIEADAEEIRDEVQNKYTN